MTHSSASAPDLKPPRGAPASKRPGQTPPQHNRADKRRCSDDGRAEEEPPAADDEAQDSNSAWAQRMQQEQAHWSTLLPSMQAGYFHALPIAVQARRKAQQQHLALLQLTLDAYSQQHTCSCQEEQELQFSAVDSRRVKYIGMACVGELSLTTWRCDCCATSFQPDPLAIGCFPSSPVQPDTLFDMQMMQAYQVYGLRGGLSATGVAAVATGVMPIALASN